MLGILKPWRYLKMWYESVQHTRWQLTARSVVSTGPVPLNFQKRGRYDDLFLLQNRKELQKKFLDSICLQKTAGIAKSV
jgi:hypothetical protein